MDIKLKSSKSLTNEKKIKKKSKSIKNYLIEKESIEKRNLNKNYNLDEYFDNIYLDDLELHN